MDTLAHVSHADSSSPSQGTTVATARLYLLTFGLTLFLSAGLLFVVQPMVGKLVLPTLGGTPAVWNTCMVFFQAVLLAGYAYAHASVHWLGVRMQARVHLGVLLLPLLALPIAFEQTSPAPTGDLPVGWLIWRLLLAVGLPFFVVSTSAPLLQKWFSRTGHPDAHDPYFLYGASNCGSLLALLGYPLVIEPLLPTLSQTRWWAFGYGLLALLVMGCALLLWRALDRASSSEAGGESAASETRRAATRADQSESPSTPAGAAATPSWRQRAAWLFFAAVPSSLMLGVTTHVTTDLAPMPLLWVVPLALYLLTFVIVFAQKPLIPLKLSAMLLPYVILLAAVLFLDMQRVSAVLIPVHMLVFFVAALVCHGRLAAMRPSAARLTEFYLWMSIGGVVGGLFNAVVAPLAFTSIIEYPLAMMLACLALPAAAATRSKRVGDVAWPAGIALLGLAVVMWLDRVDAGADPAFRAPVIALLAAICFAFKDRPWRLALGFAAMQCVSIYHASLETGRVLHSERNFFGMKRVVVDAETGEHQLVHGGTFHGSQSTDPRLAGVATAYYHRSGPLGDVFTAWRESVGLSDAPPRVGVIGLGAGAMATYARPDDHFRFFEIDPAIARIAQDPRYFTFLKDAAGELDVVLGDGRLTVASERDASFSLIVLDAFSSDSIPAHLVTREALQLYLSKLSEGGLLAFHVSNRYLDLKRVLSALAADADLVALYCADALVTPDQQLEGKTPSEWVVMARRDADLAYLPRRERWEALEPNAESVLWTDQFSNVLSLVRW